MIAFNIPPIPGLGSTGGLELYLPGPGRQARPRTLGAALRGFIFALNQDPNIGQAFSTYTADVPQLFLDVDRDKVEALGIPVSDVFATLQANLGSYYVNDFNLFNRVYRVIIQAESEDRKAVEDIGRIHVRNAAGEMVPMRTLVNDQADPGAGIDRTLQPLQRRFRSTPRPPPGKSTGQAIQAITDLANSRAARRLRASSGPARPTSRSRPAATRLSSSRLALVFVYLFLVAQYESWTIPHPGHPLGLGGRAGRAAGGSWWCASTSISIPRSAWSC